ncbi:hypothetical protein BX666DRAFT_1899525 [Dichotomocladium elegans]|nr:hypothetical protein BX666DRAFT_1899525 [Dichotomocladium elegans]
MPTDKSSLVLSFDRVLLHSLVSWHENRPSSFPSKLARRQTLLAIMSTKVERHEGRPRS